jgi:hypothetical protein
MNENELKEAIKAGKGGATFGWYFDREKAVYYTIPSSALRGYYINLLVLAYLPALLLIALIAGITIIYHLDLQSFDGLAILALVFYFLWAALLNYFFGYLGVFLPFRSVNSEEDKRHRFPPINAPISEWMLKNVRCPVCNGPIKNYAWRCEWSHLRYLRGSADLCEVQCKNCNRKFVFDKRGSTFVLVDEIKKRG